VLLVFCLFMISISQPEQYYQVSHFSNAILRSSPKPFIATPLPRVWYGYRHWDHVYPNTGSYLTLLPEATRACNRNCYLAKSIVCYKSAVGLMKSRGPPSGVPYTQSCLTHGSTALLDSIRGSKRVERSTEAYCSSLWS